MKPISICLVQMGEKGLEMVKSYPDVLPTQIMNEITIKSMPLGAKEGDFTTNVSENGTAFAGYVFSIPKKTERDNIASIVAVFDGANYNSNNVRKLFSVLIRELKNNNAITVDVIERIMPSIFSGFGSKNVKIKISSIVTVEMDIEEDLEDESEGKTAAKSLAEDMWR